MFKFFSSRTDHYWLWYCSRPPPQHMSLSFSWQHMKSVTLYADTSSRLSTAEYLSTLAPSCRNASHWLSRTFLFSHQKWNRHHLCLRVTIFCLGLVSQPLDMFACLPQSALYPWTALMWSKANDLEFWTRFLVSFLSGLALPFSQLFLRKGRDEDLYSEALVLATLAIRKPSYFPSNKPSFFCGLVNTSAHMVSQLCKMVKCVEDNHCSKLY